MQTIKQSFLKKNLHPERSFPKSLHLDERLKHTEKAMFVKAPTYVDVDKALKQHSRLTKRED